MSEDDELQCLEVIENIENYHIHKSNESKKRAKDCFNDVKNFINNFEQKNPINVTKELNIQNHGDSESLNSDKIPSKRPTFLKASNVVNAELSTQKVLSSSNLSSKQDAPDLEKYYIDNMGGLRRISAVNKDKKERGFFSSIFSCFTPSRVSPIEENCFDRADKLQKKVLSREMVY